MCELVAVITSGGDTISILNSHRVNEWESIGVVKVAAVFLRSKLLCYRIITQYSLIIRRHNVNTSCTIYTTTSRIWKRENSEKSLCVNFVLFMESFYMHFLTCYIGNTCCCLLYTRCIYIWTFGSWQWKRSEYKFKIKSNFKFKFPSPPHPPTCKHSWHPQEVVTFPLPRNLSYRIASYHMVQYTATTYRIASHHSAPTTIICNLHIITTPRRENA